jgi:hypothetical protein
MPRLPAFCGRADPLTVFAGGLTVIDQCSFVLQSGEQQDDIPVFQEVNRIRDQRLSLWIRA